MASEATASQDKEFKTIASLTECESAKVTGIITEVSPMTPTKKGTEYFHATLNDGTQETRVVGFRKRQRDLLQQFEESGEPVDILACKIKRSKFGDDHNVMMANKTAVVTSPTKISIDREKLAKRSNLQLCDLPCLSDGTRVSCTVKVLRVEAKALVSGGQSLQNVIISDSTMANKIVLWNDDIDKLKVGNSYHLKQVLVRSYQGDKFLQYPKQGATCEEIEDIGTVSLDDVNTYDTITNSEVAGVLSFDNFLVCLVCKSKVQPADEKLGTCTGCKTLLKISLCKRQVRAKLLLTCPGGSYITLNVFGDHLKLICCQEAVSEENLLQASPFSFTYNNQIINSISREDSQ